MTKKYWLQVRSTVSNESFDVGSYTTLKEAVKAWHRIQAASKLPLLDCYVMTTDASGPVNVDYYRVDGNYSNCSNIGAV